MQEPKENESTDQEVEASPKKDDKPVETPAEVPKEDPSKKEKTKMIKMSTDELLQWEQRLKELTTKSKKAEKENETLKLEMSKMKSQIDNNEIRFKDEQEKGRKAEIKFKNTIEGLEEKNKGFLQMVDEASSKGQIQNGKIKDMELSKDAMAKQLKEKSDELVAFQERYKQEGNFEKSIVDLKLQNKNLQAKIKELEVQLVSHQEKEAEEKQRPKIDVVKSESFVKMQNDYEALKLKNSELAKQVEETRVEVEKEQKLNLYLTKEIEELQGQQKKHEIELEEETRSMREDLMKMKKVRSE
jgi:hypothetical protein